MTDVRKPIVQPIDATAYAMPKRNIDPNVRVFPVAMLGVMMRGFHPASMATPMTTSAMPITIDTNFALRSIAFVKSRETEPTMMKTAMKPEDVATPTRSARASDVR